MDEKIENNDGSRLDVEQRPLDQDESGERIEPGAGWAMHDGVRQQASTAEPLPYYYAPQVVNVPRGPGTLHKWRAKGGVVGGLAGALMFIVKVVWPALALFGKLKFLLITGGSMLLSMWLYATMFGWPFAVGIVMLIFIHECGHALAAHRSGLKYGFMLFVPMMGAFVTTKGFGRNLVTDAYIGIMGPIIGTFASVAVALAYIPTHNLFWLALGQWGFLVNLFNLLPTPPLDGGWITPLFSPKLLAIGAVIAFVVGFKNPLIWLLLIVSLPRIVGGWKADPKTQPYYNVPIAEKWKYGMLYVGLAVFLAVGGIVMSDLLGGGPG
jgi:Zn-dependent protease